MKIRKKRVTLRYKFALLGGSIVFVVIAVLFSWMLSQSEKAIVDRVDAQADSLLQQIIVTRQWIADLGGLFVRKTGHARSAHSAPTTDIDDASGLHYVTLNPAMITRQLAEYSSQAVHYRFHVTSLNPVNARNAPDAFERQALERFRREGYLKSRDGLARRDVVNGRPVYRRMIPLMTEASCLGCHEAQGYRLGEVQAGISVSIPMDAAAAAIRATRARLIAAGFAIVLLVAGALYFLVRRLVLVPVEHLHTVSESIEAGEYDVRARVHTGDELQDLARALNRMTTRVRAGYEGAVKSLAAAIEARDPYTSGHIDRVARYTFAIARELGWSREEQDRWRIGVVLHDIGKIGIRDAVLQKQGPLNDEERAEMQAHPRIGGEIAVASESDLLIRELPAILYHHERFDGMGYPAGLRGKDIPLIARVLSVADVYDALITDRPYRKAMTVNAAIGLIKSDSGSQFDPDVVRAFLAAWEKGFAEDEAADREKANDHILTS